MDALPDREAEPRRELVITIPLREDRGLRGDGRARAHWFRSHGLELVRRLRAFRDDHGLTQAEVARVVGAVGESAVCQWERGLAVPDGPRRERVGF